MHITSILLQVSGGIWLAFLIRHVKQVCTAFDATGPAIRAVFTGVQMKPTIQAHYQRM